MPDNDTGSMIAALCDELIHTRQHTGPKHLTEPGPDEAMLREILRAAAAAPDHERLRPWRLIVIGQGARDRLGQAFADALVERDPQALPQQLQDARDKAIRGPLLMLAVADLREAHEHVHELEKLVSLGCGVQNLLLAAHARGFGTGLSSGKALRSKALREGFKLQPGEEAVCFISVGTATRRRPVGPRPMVEDIASWI